MRTPTRTPTYCALAALGLLLMGPARASRVELLKPKVWVAPVQPADAKGAGLIAKKLDEAIRREVGKLTAVRSVGPGQRVLRIKAGAADPRVVQAENLRNNGQAAFGLDDMDAARVDLEAALQLYELGLASVTKVEAIGRTHAFLGAIAAKQRRKQDAERHLRAAAQLSSGPNPVEGLPPHIKRRLEGLRKRGGKGRAQLTVRTEPKGAVVRINGIDRGRSPVRVRRLAKGLYYVQAQHPEAGAAAAKVTLNRRAKLTLTLQSVLGEAPPERVEAATLKGLMAAAGSASTRSLRRHGREAAARTHAQYLVLTRLSAEGDGFLAQGQVYGVAPDRLVSLPALKIGADLSGLLASSVAFAKAVDAAIAELASMPPAKERRRRRR